MSKMYMDRIETLKLTTLIRNTKYMKRNTSDEKKISLVHKKDNVKTKIPIIITVIPEELSDEEGYIEIPIKCDLFEFTLCVMYENMHAREFLTGIFYKMVSCKLKYVSSDAFSIKTSKHMN